VIEQPHSARYDQQYKQDQSKVHRTPFARW
jgi:hypothetical protein